MVARPKLQGAVGFVLYELWMLRECAHMRMPIPRVSRNLWYEGLALHARVLRDFFFTKVYQEGKNQGKQATRPEDILAVDFFATKSSWTASSADLPPYLAKNKERMDAGLAHLSFNRLKYETEGKDWSAQHLLSEIGAKWFEFLDRLKSDNSAAFLWFRNHRRARLVPFLPPI